MFKEWKQHKSQLAEDESDEARSWREDTEKSAGHWTGTRTEKQALLLSENVNISSPHWGDDIPNCHGMVGMSR